MLRQYIDVGNNAWTILVYYNVDANDYNELAEILYDYGCSKQDIIKSLRIVTKHLNTGLTFTNTEFETSIVCISATTSGELFVNTLVHEAKHVQSHICSHYEVDEDGEQAAYLIGYIVQNMYRALKKYGKF